MTINAISAESSVWSPVRVLVVALCFVLNMLDGTDIAIMSFIAPVLSEHWAISPQRLGVVFSASLAGMAIGCLLVAPLGDKWGRRFMIVAALAVVAAAMTLSALARSVGELIIARLIVGVGVGTIGVSMTAMAAEYAPDAYASFSVALVQAGWPLGSIITAFAAAALLSAHAWQVLLFAIGVLSAALFFVIYFLLPESLAFLNSRRPPGALGKTNAIRERLRLAPLTQLPKSAGRAQSYQVSALFSEGRMRASVLLWCAVTLCYFDLYFVISWIPKLVAQAGLPVAQAIYAGATYNVGAFLGTAAVGWIAIRYRLRKVIACFLGLAAVAMLIFGGLTMPVWMTLFVALCIGVTVQGGFNGYWAMAARLYPVQMRSTGVGWALGVGRIGAVLGPIIGGVLVGAQLPSASIFAIFAVPLVLAAAMTVFIKVDAND